ncbi:TRAP transporter small permease [Salipiger sp. 1_MG-2023]|uniref:TRAP transporter small permease subunit n=1 Tax=Salipiger sp. 1_MG-2023 TaxID=3062665 RepID=UPI0026E2165F|nr:TRAP transporter small permease [Salipiger sp. 1_MG-2023]MDO6584733.1 TRAP transporter small permease [Salipiger sp. 1_MG-2023]
MSDIIDETLANHNKTPEAAPEAGAFGRAVNAVGVLFAIGILASAALLMYEVVLRYAFNAPTKWVHETVVFLSAIAFVYGGLYAAAIDKHIRVVIFYDRMSEGLRRLFDVGISVICLVASVFFAWAAWLSVKRAAWTPQGEFRLETSGSAWNPAYPGLLKIFLLVILILLAIQFAIFTVNYLRKKAD